MTYNPERHHRCSLRLKNYDYSQAGAYFITICSHNRECLFGEIKNGQMVLNEYGKIVKNEWMKSTEIRNEIKLDEFVIMPNHIHGIVIMVGANRRSPNMVEANRRSPLHNIHMQPKSISSFVAGCKSSVTKQINILRQMPNFPVWQRNYYEHIIRDEDNLNQIREYIINNPVKWELDSNHPKNIKW